jgi:hypothetical protein
MGGDGYIGSDTVDGIAWLLLGMLQSALRAKEVESSCTIDVDSVVAHDSQVVRLVEILILMVLPIFGTAWLSTTSLAFQ